MNIIHSLLTRSNITLALSIFGSVGTLISFIFSVFKNRKNISIEIAGRRFSDKPSSLLVYILFENKSRLPISITNISVELDSVWYPCKKNSKHCINRNFNAQRNNYFSARALLITITYFCDWSWSYFWLYLF